MASDIQAASIREIFSAAGALTRALPGFEFRDGQLEMALAVERALGEERVLLCEAGTGTGKTLAYLIPAILSGKKVVVSTATRALQEQILHHDLPLIERALGLSVHAALMKGLGNYLCLRRFQAARNASTLLHTPAQRKLMMVEDWAKTTEQGDLSELDQLAENDEVLGRVSSSSETRVGSSCIHYDDCFVTRMKRRAAAAQLVIVNHHLFFADLALRGPHPGQVLPDYDAVIFDEAHHLEDIATEFFSVRVSTTKLEALTRDAELTFGAMQRPAAQSVVGSVELAAQHFFDHVRAIHQGTDGKTAVASGTWNGAGARAWHDLDTALEALSAVAAALSGSEELQGSAGLLDQIDALARRTERLRHELANIVEAGSDFVAWVELGNRTVGLYASPVDLAPVLRNQLFDLVPTAVLTSATLSDSGQSKASTQRAGTYSGVYRFQRQRLGLDEAMAEPLELVVPAPFDFQQRSLLYVPGDLPSPGAADFSRCVAKRVQELIAITDGGAFVLTTSLKAMQDVHGELRANLGTKLLLMQGEAPKHVLLDRFKKHGRAVLVATMSFWEGVDVPGASLRLVIMDKVPFPVPSDPILRARAEKLEQAGHSGFRDLYLPLAQRLLKQGFGRLLRHHTDAGIVAVLDSRLKQKGYGKRLLSALPPAPCVDTLQEVSDFWDRYREVPLQAAPLQPHVAL